jgi:hypothetical protein
MAISIDEVTAQVDPDVSTSMQGSQSQGNSNQVSPETELRRSSELQSYIAIRAARLRAE